MAATTGDVRIRLDYRPPLAWDALLAFLAYRSIPGVELRGPLTLGFNAIDFVAAYNLIDVFCILAAA